MCSCFLLIETLSPGEKMKATRLKTLPDPQVLFLVLFKQQVVLVDTYNTKGLMMQLSWAVILLESAFGSIVAQVNPTSVSSLNTLHGSPSWAWTEQFFCCCSAGVLPGWIVTSSHLSGNVVQQILLLTCFSNYVVQDIYPWHVKSPEIIVEEHFQEKKNSTEEITKVMHICLWQT